MRERLIQYVDLLFAAAPNSTEIKQEILQNTLDRYDDLVAQGKSEEAAYRLAISGIGDINEILDSPVPSVEEETPVQNADPEKSRKLRATAIALYIASAIPLFILGDLGYGTMGLCMTILMVAAATYVLLLSRKSESKVREEKPRDPRKEKLDRITTTISVTLFLVVSFLTNAWYITWLIFPITGCVEGLINAIHDLKEANPYEN